MSEGESKEIPGPEKKVNLSKENVKPRPYGKDEDREEDPKWIDWGVDKEEQGKYLKNKKTNRVNMSNQEKESNFEQSESKSEAELKPKGWIFSEDELGQIKDPQLKKHIRFLEKTPTSLRNEQRLYDFYVKIENYSVSKEENVPQDESDFILAKLNEKINELAATKKEAQPEIEKYPLPESAEKAVDFFLQKVFDLHERGLRERKKWEEQGELFSEFTALHTWVEDVSPKDEFKGTKNVDLSEALQREYPKGVYLKEKLELFLEAIKRLHNREIEVIRSGGSLVDLGVAKTEEKGAPILKVPFTHIRPLDFYLLTHADGLFPESKNPENRFEVQKAWDKWQEIGKYSYGFYEIINKKTKKENGKEKRINEIRLNEEIPKAERENLIEQGKGKWAYIRWNLDKLEKIKESFLDDDDEVQPGYSLEEMFNSDRITTDFRNSIAAQVGEDLENQIAGVRSESLAHSLLQVGLTFELWDRERWRIISIGEARDLMWFDWKRISRLEAAPSIRPSGPWDTVGCYFADEKQMTDKNKLTKLNQRLRQTLERNLKDAVFIVKPETPSMGTIVGDFYNSIKFEDEKSGKTIKLADSPTLKEIPWLKPEKFDTDFYVGYFGYNLYYGAIIEREIKNLGHDPKDLKSKDFWVGLTDSTYRLQHICPSLITSKDRQKTNRIIFKFRRILARGIFWNGSYLSQANPDSLLSTGTFSREDVYGERVLGFIKGQPGILDAIKSVGFLDKANMNLLESEIYKFNFHLRGSTRRFA